MSLGLKFRFLTGVAMLALLGASPMKALPEKIGDFDEDGLASILDVVRLINHVNGSRVLPADLVPFADINNDGSVDQDDVEGLVDRVLERLPLESLPLTFLSRGSPSSGEGGVAVTRETVLRFSSPLGTSHGLDAESLYAEFGGNRLSTRIHVSSDRKTVTLFYNAPLPANSRIRVTLVGDEVLDNRGRNLDGDGDGQPGGNLVFDFDTLGLTVLEGTSICGRVFASELTVAAAADVNVNRPLEGAKITVDGMEDQIFAVTDEFGNFRLEPAPVGRFFVHIDGRTVTIDVPAGAYYPFVGKAWESIPGEEVNVGSVYLPLVKEGTLQEVSNTESKTIRMPSVVIDEFPDFADVTITVPAGSLFSDNGTRGGKVGIAPVDPSRLPGQLPPDLNFSLVITVQTDGATNFDIPAAVCFPNLPDLETGAVLEPGAKSALWSFNHDTGRFEIGGSMTVSSDGALICSDPGQGVLAPGWHGTRPGAVVEGGVIVTASPGSSTDFEAGSSPESRAPPGCTLWGLCGPLNKLRNYFQGTSDTAHSDAGTGAEILESAPEAVSNDGNGDPIYYFSGEFSYSALDFQIKGRGLDFIWSRRYRSKVGPNTEQGNGWDFAYKVKIEQEGADLILFDGNSRSDRYTADGVDRWTRGEFFRELTRNPDGSFTLEFEDRGRWIFNSFESPSDSGKINAIVDRNGNHLDFFYDGQGRLIRVNDTLDRDITIAYNADGFISAVTDFIGRTVSYEYYDGIEPGGGFGDLKSCTSPAVTGTPTGNDFPNGKKTSYTYTTGFADERLNHNLLTITDGRRNDPSDPTFGDGPYLVNVYSATQNPNDFNFDRVVRQVWGGDVVDIVYEPLAPAGANAASTKTILNDRNGNVTEYYFDDRNRVVVLREFTGRANPTSPTNSLSNRPTNKLRSTDPNFFETRYAYNEDSLVTEIIHPNGNITENIYEGDLNPAASPRVRGNLRIARRLPGTHVPAGDQDVIEEFFEYDSDFGCGACGFNFVTRHTDGRGNSSQMTYDDRGNLISQIERIETIVENFEYNEFGQLTAHTLPDNGSNHRRRDEYTYYGSGIQRGYLKDEIVDVENLALTTTTLYDAVGSVTGIIDPRGHDTIFMLNQLDQVVRTISREVTDGSSIRYEQDFFYDANNNVVRIDVMNIGESGILDANTHFTNTWEYEILNNPIRTIQEIDGSSDVVKEYVYDANRNQILMRDGEATNGNQPDNIVSYIFDERDLLFREIRAPSTPAQSTKEYSYDKNRNLTDLRLGIEDSPRITAHLFDGYDRVLRSTDPMGNKTILKYDANSNIVETRLDGELVDKLGSTDNVRLGEAFLFYDDVDRLVRTERAFFDTETGTSLSDGKAVKLITYTDHSGIKSITDDNSHSTVYSYDTAYRVTTVTDPKGNIRRQGYDANSNLTSILSIEKHDLGEPDQLFTTTYSYDNLDRRIAIIDNRDNTLLRSYDSRNNPTVSNDPNGNRTINSFDGLNRLISSTRILTGDGLGSGSQIGQIITRSVWDDSSRLVQQIDPKNNITETVYDPLNRPVARIFADGTQRSAGYDVHYNIIFEDDANGNQLEMAYDLRNRMISREVTPGAGVSTDTTFELFAFDGLSRLVSAEDDDSLVLRSYDSLSRITSETLNGQTTESVFDGVGNLLNCVYPGGRNIEYEYDDLDRKSAVIDSTIPASPESIANFDYLGPARVARRNYGNGTRTEFTYDGITGIADPVNDFGVQNIIGIRHTKVGTGSVIAEHTYTWDRVGNKIARDDLEGGIASNFEYDSAYRLQISTIDAATTDYSIDLGHNRTQVSGSQNPGVYISDATTPEPADAQLNQYTSTPQGNRIHDANGNLVSDAPGRLFTYDFANRMVSFSGDGDSASYQYDVFGRRIAKTLNGVTTKYFYSDIVRVCEEQDAASITVATYVYGLYVDDVIQMKRGSSEYFYHCDDLYSTIALSDVNGDMVESIAYSDFGEPTSSSIVNNPYLFTGRRYDPETGFYYYRTRYLDPVAGQFTSRDSIGIWGDQANLGNGYAYVANNPKSLLDPFGLGPWYVPQKTVDKLIIRPVKLVLSGGANLATFIGGVGVVTAGAPVAGVLVAGVAIFGFADNGVEISNIYLGRESARGSLSRVIEWIPFVGGVLGRRGSDTAAAICGIGANWKTLTRLSSAAVDLPNRAAQAAQQAKRAKDLLGNRLGAFDTVTLGGNILVVIKETVSDLWEGFFPEVAREPDQPDAVFERVFDLPSMTNPGPSPGPKPGWVRIRVDDEAGIQSAIGRGSSFYNDNGVLWEVPSQ